ncbi:hypothetical protein O181_114413 [Austropuccinia psidii MF-1]|uniref:Uncharacterized protein n=1 Tax=Austropuccinia psidii MF-1 TaxID=1389203 RepID=A0A9Q3PUI9_9BASI|nr:hypothetical protein [Austropuccinia psidii MF-1]
MSENLDKGPPMEGEGPSRREGVKSKRSISFSGLLCGYPRISQGPESRLGDTEDEEGECEEKEVAAAFPSAPNASEAANIAHSNQCLVSQAEPNFIIVMEKMTKFMGQLTQAVSPTDNSRAPTFKTPSMKAPYSFDGTQTHKLRGLIQLCQLNLQNNAENFFYDKKMAL